MRIDEVAVKQKAGVIPYYIGKDGLPQMMFMVPSDPAYGGTEIQIAKGSVDPGENIQQAAVREGVEELGLVASNIVQIKQIASTQIIGLDASYQLTIFGVEIKDPNNFTKPHFETGYCGFHTLREFKAKGRNSQLSIVIQLHNLLTQK